MILRPPAAPTAALPRGWLAALARRAGVGRHARVRGSARVPAMRQVARVPDPLRPPRSLAERSAAAWLDRVGSIPFDALVERVAHALYLDELRHGGWALDLGFLGPGLFVREAAQVIEAANGVLWLMEPSAGGDP